MSPFNTILSNSDHPLATAPKSSNDLPPHPYLSNQNPPTIITRMQFSTTATLLALTAAILPAAVTAEIICQGYLTDPSDIAACADELTLRSNEACTVTGSTTTFCQIGTARIVGVSTGTPIRAETSSSW